jgi:hypothetical protein
MRKEVDGSAMIRLFEEIREAFPPLFQSRPMPSGS